VAEPVRANGSARSRTATASGLPDDVALFCDPDEAVYRAYGPLEETPIEVLYDAPDAYLRCEPDAGHSLFEQRRGEGRPMVDNPWHLPGEFVVDQSGRLVTTHRYQYLEHWTDPRVHVATIRVTSGKLAPVKAGKADTCALARSPVGLVPLRPSLGRRQLRFDVARSNRKVIKYHVIAP